MSGRWVILTALTVVGVVLIVLSGRLFNHHLFGSTVLVNLGTGVLVVVAISLVARYLESRIAIAVDAELRRVERRIQDLQYAAMGLPASPRLLDPGARREVRGIRRRERARFDRLDRSRNQGALASLLNEGAQKGYLSSEGISVRLDGDLGFQFSYNNGWSVISFEPRSLKGLKARFGGQNDRLYVIWKWPRWPFPWRSGANFSKAMAQARHELLRKGFQATERCVNADEVWRSLMRTLRFAFGIRGDDVVPPLRFVREMDDDKWVIADYEVYSVSNDLGITRDKIWDNSAVAAVRDEADKQGLGESFDRAVASAKELFFLTAPDRPGS